MPPIPKGSLHKASKDFLADLNLPEGVKKTLDSYLEAYEAEGFELLDGLFTKYGLHQHLGDLIDPKNQTVVGQHHQILITIVLGIAMAVIGGVVGHATAPSLEGFGQNIQQSNPQKIPDLETLIRYLRIFPAQRPVILDKMAKLGFSTEHTNLIVDATASYLAPDLMLRALHRGLTTDKQYSDYMRIFGFSGYDTKLLKDLSQVIPPVQDLISMAVREAFNEEASARFKLDFNFPQAVVPYAEAQGLSKEWLARYWRAHWQLPSINQGFEMFQRLRPGTTNNPFTQADLSELMVTADIPEFFRNRLLEIAYTPVTRVDIRRLYKMGIFKEADVLAAYQDAGYSPKNAENLTKFTVLDAIDSEGDITKAEILSAFKDGFMTEAQASKALLDAHNSLAVVTFEIALAKHQMTKELNKQKIDLIKQQYINGLIDDGAMIVQLNALGLLATQVQVIIANAHFQRNSRLVLPTKTDIQDWYEERIISDFEFTNYYMRLGFSPAEIQKYLRAINVKIALKAQATMEANQAKVDKQIEQNKVKTYQHQVALIDLAISQLQLAIANIKLAISKTTDAVEIEQFNEQIKGLEVQIKTKTVQKAQVKAL